MRLRRAGKLLKKWLACQAHSGLIGADGEVAEWPKAAVC